MKTYSLVLDSESKKEVALKCNQREQEHNFSQYLVGFTDGEGCFSVSFQLRKKVKIGIECTPSFVISQKKSEKNVELLKRIRDFFNCGAIRYSRTDDCYKYEIRSLAAIQKSIIPFFQENQLLAEKRYHFQYFCKICSLMRGKQHLSKKGMLSILQLAKKMNPSGRRKNKIENLQAFLTKKDKAIIKPALLKKKAI